MSDDRFWITNPAGHRAWADEMDTTRDGDLVEFLGREAVVIKPPSPPAADWICDICNAQLLTRWGAEPFPVPMTGGYALCDDHRTGVEEGPDFDRWGEPIPGTTLGPWPANVCACPPCRNTVEAWREQYARALGIIL